jgi:hypothetical protein
MTQQKHDGSLEALVAADEGGSSGPPGGAQAPVADDTCDLRAREAEAWAALVKADSEVPIDQIKADAAYAAWGKAYREYEASKTHVGGNGALSNGGKANNERR